jgi:hypothetical protein
MAKGIFSRLDGVSSIAGLAGNAISNWASISSYLSGGALMSALAYFQALPPLYWGIAFFAGLVLVALVRAITKWGTSRDALARLYEATAAQPHSFNRLKSEFVRETVKISDLIHPLGEPIRGKAFIDCEFHGPGLLVLSGCNFDGFGGGNVELIRLQSSKGTMMDCNLVRCRCYNVAIALTSDSVDELKARMGKVPVVGE